MHKSFSSIGEYMRVHKRCILTDKINSMELDITLKSYLEHQKGKLAQDAFPHLNADEREFLISGITPEVWEETFGRPEQQKRSL